MELLGKENLGGFVTINVMTVSYLKTDLLSACDMPGIF